MWICEFCFRLLEAGQLPDDWQWVWQSAVCPDCRVKVARDGGYMVVRGGAYATEPDPRIVGVMADALDQPVPCRVCGEPVIWWAKPGSVAGVWMQGDVEHWHTKVTA